MHVERNLVKHERFEANFITGLLGNLISTTSEDRTPLSRTVCAFCSHYYDRLDSKEGQR